ncbi:penicillin-binding protein 1C [Saccharicrinis sp. FJH62]|uniref:penicillin-binding protein 1C n=1 Tax=Saccharicrinis sp. FJH62 TaxID=3344657 RepID=UPI0035D47ADD
MIKRKQYRRKGWMTLYVMVFAVTLVMLITPLPRFTTDYATLILSEEGDFLNAAVSSDEQWRFEPLDSVPDHFKKALVTFEDQHFYSHFGVNPLAVFRALTQNIKAGHVVSGGSTITMQIARMSRNGKSRNLWQKGLEVLMAVKLEMFDSKDDILKLYATNAPFGGNTVGLEAASWRYFQRSPYELSWAEAATLAVLPNAPSLIYPGKNSVLLKDKRDRLLTRLFEAGYFDKTTLELALLETLPDPPGAVAAWTPHLMNRLIEERGKGRFKTTLSGSLQKRVVQIVNDFAAAYKQQGINNVAALVMDLDDYSVKAYVGNCADPDRTNGGDVDVIMAPRSSGSILKPFLYAASICDGTILPDMLLPDVPTYLNGFTPENFNKKYDGLVPAGEALVRSLNIPFVMLLKEYGIPGFYDLLQSLQFSKFNRSPDHYGLSMILGGGEVTLWELARAYGSMGNMLNNEGRTFDIFEPRLLMGQDKHKVASVLEITPGGAWITLDKITNLTRPDEEAGWHYFTSKQRIAWKTGTSFGFRDAWAVGVTAHHLIAVWVGNADGQGMPGLTGTSKAAPVMFRLFEQLNEDGGFFNTPWDDLTYYPVCSQSGELMTSDCDLADTIIVPAKANYTSVCEYHKTIHLTADGQYRVNSSCYDPNRMIHKKWFAVPPKFSVYFRRKDSNYRDLPPVMPGCGETKMLSFTYPNKSQKLYLPVDFDGKRNPVVFEAAHEEKNAEMRWFLDEAYLGSTRYNHQVAIQMDKGVHVITICDLAGNEDKIRVEVMNEEE